MSERRTIVLLLLATALFAALNVLLSVCGVKRVAIAAHRTLVDPSETTGELVVERRGVGRTRIVRSPDWRIAEPYDASADETIVLKALDALSQTPVTDSISEHDLLRLGRTRADYDLENPPLTVKAGDAPAVSFGSLTPDAKGVYAVVEGTDRVFVVPTNVVASVDRDASGFRRRTLFASNAGVVDAFDIKRAKGSVLSFTREGGIWKLAGERASSAKVEEFLSSLTGAVADGFIWPTGAAAESAAAPASSLAAWGLDPESAVTVTLKSRGDGDMQISFGKRADEKSVYALAQAGKAVVTVSSALKDLAMRDVPLYVDTHIFQRPPRSVKSFSVMSDGVLALLARTADGWRLESPVSAPADAAFAQEVLQRVLSLTTADAGKGGVEVSIEGDPRKISVARERVFAERGMTDLRSGEIIDIDPSMVKRVVVSGASGTKAVSVVFDRVRRTWNVESAGETPGAVDEGAVAALTAALDPLGSLGVVALKISPADQARYGLEKPFLTVAIDEESADSFRRNILVGAAAPGGRYATVGSSDALFIIADDVIETLSKPLLRSPK